MVQKVPVGKDGLFALVDDEDMALVSQYKWHISTAGYAEHNYWDKGRSHIISMHRLILGLGPGDPDVDHANHDGFDNRRENLRIATDSQNQANARKQRRGTSSKYKGVYWHRDAQRWHASIRIHGERISLGHFYAETDAARAYDSAAAYFFGAYAYLNFPDTTPALYVPRPKPASECRGICREASRSGPNKWRARFERNGKRHFVGRFLTEQDAITALQTYKQEHGV